MVKIAIPNFCINFLNKTEKSLPILCDFAVTSLADAWIKMLLVEFRQSLLNVASLADAWIKICRLLRSARTSHPSGVRGLKFFKLCRV